MSTEDIKKLRRILKYKNRTDIAELLKESRSYLDESSTFGSRWYSTISTFRIYSPLKFNDKLDSLSNEDKNEIFKAVRLIYPVQDSSPEIINIEYLVDFEIKDNDVVETNHLEEIDFDYIHQQISKCNEKISKNDYEGSVTNAKK